MTCFLMNENWWGMFPSSVLFTRVSCRGLCQKIWLSNMSPFKSPEKIRTQRRWCANDVLNHFCSLRKFNVIVETPVTSHEIKQKHTPMLCFRGCVASFFFMAKLGLFEKSSDFQLISIFWSSKHHRKKIHLQLRTLTHMLPWDRNIYLYLHIFAI